MVNSSHGFKRMLQQCLQAKDLVHGMTETDSVQVGLEQSAFTSGSLPFYF